MGGLALQEIPGDHYSLLRGPNVEDLASRLTALLDGGDLTNPANAVPSR